MVTISPGLTASVGASDWPNASPIIVVASIKAASEAAKKTDPSSLIAKIGQKGKGFLRKPVSLRKQIWQWLDLTLGAAAVI